MHYRVPDKDAAPLIRQTLAWLFRSIDLRLIVRFGLQSLE